MLDFVNIKVKDGRWKGSYEIYPEFIVKKSKDLMIRGKSFYAVWDEELGLWSTDENDVQRLVDQMIREFYEQNEIYKQFNTTCKFMSEFSSNKWMEYQKYCRSMPDNYHELDKRIIFSNEKVTKKDYVTKILPYPLEDCSIDSYEEIMSTLYSESDRRKLEWAIGSIIAGDSKKIQKFIVLYGAPGTGKSTVLKIIEQLFPGYFSYFDSEAISSSSNAFAAESFRNNPLIAIQHDGDLSRIETNTKLNSIVSHEPIIINEKFKSTYESAITSFLFMGTNKPVRITDAKAGILRRLIDVNPTGEKIPTRHYNKLMNHIKFELGGIAKHCLEVYQSLGMDYYNDYIPVFMMGETNDFFNFMEENYDFFCERSKEGVSLRTIWLRYKEYCEFTSVKYPLPMRNVKIEAKEYFREFHEHLNGVAAVYVGFKKRKFHFYNEKDGEKDVKGDNRDRDCNDISSDLDLSMGRLEEGWIQFTEQNSLFDTEFADCFAQYSNEEGIPTRKWENCKTKLSSIDTKKEHYVLPPDILIVIDFDLKDEKGEKSYERNLAEANKWPKTYAELSKSGRGVHLHYYYTAGNPADLSRLVDENIEVKVFTGNSALRRRVTKCNNLPIATISSGLPKKEAKKVVSIESIKSEKTLREMIKRNLRKEIHADTSSSVNFIYQILEDAYNNGLKYDVTDMRNDIQQFALGSTNQADRCLRLVGKMHFKSEEVSESLLDKEVEEKPICFFDVEVFPNLFILVIKKLGEENIPITFINPNGDVIEDIIQNFRLIGFNNRRYDNHILYARMMGYNEKQLYELSQKIINNKENDLSVFFNEAYNLSYTDIYDFMSSNNKMSLKKWEIKLGIHHQEFGHPWDQPVPEELWQEAADYCKNDVMATEAVWYCKDVQSDWLAREILADLSGLTVNDTTNQHTTKIIVGDDRNPQSQFIYTDLSTIFPGYEYSQYGIDKERYLDPNQIVKGKSIYRGEDPGEGGYVYANPGIYGKVALLDVASMHPHSLIRLQLFGETYTARFADIVGARIMIKHKEYDAAKKILDGKLAKYLDDPGSAKKLANALKTAINSVYGLTSAKFANKLRDPRNKDNIVAKYGALFMINLKHEVEERGYKVVHIKTDSIKIADATPEIISFVSEYGAQYGYTFEHEATYEKICLVNDAVYIARYAGKDWCERMYNYIPEKNQEEEYQWTATGTQFQIPYVFKTLFSHEDILFEDLCETKSVTGSMYLNFNEGLEDGENDLRFVGRVGFFCPVKDGIGGALLLREAKDKEGNIKYDSVVGTKGYRWMEAEMVKQLGKEDVINTEYYDNLVDEAIKTISKFGDFEHFSSNVKDDLSWLYIPDWIQEEEVPFDDFPMNKPIKN